MKLFFLSFMFIIVCLDFSSKKQFPNCKLQIEEFQSNVLLKQFIIKDTSPTNKNDSDFYEEKIFDTVGKKYSEDLSSILDILTYYKINIPEFKYSYILKLHIGGGGVYDNFILSNDKMPVFKTSFNRNITPIQIIYYKFQNGIVDSSIYEFLGIGKLDKL